jgi:hypothetical protein
VDIFAEQWDDLLTGIPGRSDYRDLWFDSRLVYAVVVRGQLSPVDGAIELVDIIDVQAWPRSSPLSAGHHAGLPEARSCEAVSDSMALVTLPTSAQSLAISMANVSMPGSVVIAPLPR